MRKAKRTKIDLNFGVPFRIRLVLFFFIFLLSVLTLRLFQIQVLGYEKYKSLAEGQYWILEELPARRGNILSSDNRVLAGTVVNYLLFAEPKRLDPSAKSEFVEKLAPVISDWKFETQESSPSDETYKSRGDLLLETKEKFQDFISRDLYWIGLEHDLPLDMKEKILSMKIYGLGFDEEPRRFYPETHLGAHILGFVGSDKEGNRQGYFGIEGGLDAELRGRAGKIMEERDAVGDSILAGGYKRIDPIQGRDVVLTLNSSVQYLVEKKLKEGVEKYDAKSGTAILMDPFTGEIVALANFPTYEPEKFYEESGYVDPDHHRKTIERLNKAISEVYEPGSVIKPLTVATAIDKGIVTPETTYLDNGPVQYSDYMINNWDGKHYGPMTIVELLQKSNNIGAAWVGHKAGYNNIYQYFTNFGLGEKTGIPLEGEESGLVRPLEEWRDIDLANISFGQGISATPLQVVSAFNTLANGGYSIKPKIISKLIDNGKEIEMPTKNIKQVISKQTSDTMIDLLEKAVSGGEAKYFVLKDYRIAGKTGTAQIPEEGKYAANKTNATFVGFLSGSRKLSMIVRLEEPKTSIYAAETAVPLWMNIITELVEFYGIAPDRVPDPVVQNQ
jgi:cell division protein FtsI/penicillin-binding protein 2